MTYYNIPQLLELNPEITIPNLGTVRGKLDRTGKVARFLNVPVATVPVRWRPAVKAQPWQGVHDATKPGPLPPQQTRSTQKTFILTGQPPKLDYNTHMSEYDCLGCNIYMPAIAVADCANLPVLVWAYGGGFKNGGASSPFYDCTPIVANSIELQKPVVVISLSYRINYLGFLSSKEMMLDAQEYASTIPPQHRTWYDSSVGNWGLLDLIMGLEWVQEHISAFSGNPKRVTWMGQSGGAVAASYISIIPQCHGLYQRMIMQSGGATLVPPIHPEYEGQYVFDQLCRSLRMPDGLGPLEKVAWLRTVPGEVIAELMNDSTVITFRPSIDGIICKGSALLEVSDFKRYDPNLEWVMTGTCNDEASMFADVCGPTKMEVFPYYRGRSCAPTDYHLFDQLFGTPATNKEARAISKRALTSQIFEYPVYQTCEAITAHPSCRLSRYYFERGIEKLDKMIPGLGVFHGADLFYTFGNNSYTQSFLNEDEKAFAKKVQAVWIEFATARSPKESDLPKITRSTHSTAFGTTTIHNDLGRERKSEAILFSKTLEITKTSHSPMTRMSDSEINFNQRALAFVAEMSRCGRGMDFSVPPLYDIRTIVKGDNSIPRAPAQSLPSSAPLPVSFPSSSSKAYADNRIAMKRIVSRI